MTGPMAQRAQELLSEGPLKQPDRRSCGAATLVFAEMLANAEYAARVLDGAFAEETLAMHARVTGPADVAGRMQLPWPPFLGTPPWAVARQMSVRFGLGYGLRLVRLRPLPDLIVQDGPVVLYVGSRWLPRHVVLVVDAEGDRLTIYEPSRGTLIPIHLAGTSVAGWRHPWFVVVPTPRERRTPA